VIFFALDSGAISAKHAGGLDLKKLTIVQGGGSGRLNDWIQQGCCWKTTCRATELSAPVAWLRGRRF